MNEEILPILKRILEIKEEEIKKQDKKLEEFANVLKSIEEQNKNIEKLNENVKELIQLPPVFILEYNVEDKDIHYEDARSSFIISTRLRLINKGFGIGKNLQLGIIVNGDHSSTTITSTNDTDFKNKTLSYMPKNLPHPLREIFEFDSDSTINIMRIYDDQIIHSGDFKDYTFDLNIKRGGINLKSNIGIFIHNENSNPKYYEIRLEIELGPTNELGPTKGKVLKNPEVIPYSEGHKIKIITLGNR